MNLQYTILMFSLLLKENKTNKIYEELNIIWNFKFIDYFTLVTEPFMIDVVRNT